MSNQKISEHKKIDYNYILFAIVIGLSYWSFQLYKKTMIDIKTLLLIILLGGIIAYLIEQSRYFKRGIKEIKFLVLLKNIFSWGLIGCSLFLIFNYYIHSNDVKRGEYQLEGMRGPNQEKGAIKSIFVNIKYKEKVKELKFHKKHYRDIRKYKSVTLDVTKGLFGFDVIKKQELNY